ncbi:MAG: Pr6Pr family membrane protein, partial [Bacilli bacterium]|nr:Pr6Pr family membrane protein [Bacilli bacterium]
MQIDNKLTIFIYRIILTGLGILGIILNTIDSSGKINSEMFLFFTIQTNIICVLILLYMIIKEFIFKKDFSGGIYIIKAMAMIAITITCLVYAFILLPAFRDDPSMEYSALTFKDLIVHFIIPIGFFIDYLLFDKKGLQKWFVPLISLIYFFLYMAVIFINAKYGKPFSFGEMYPYYFINVDLVGWTQTIQNIIMVIFSATVIGYLYFG